MLQENGDETQAAPVETQPVTWRHRVLLVSEVLAAVAEPAGVATYEAILRAAGTEDREEAQKIARRAMVLVRREHGYVFRAVENVGYQRLTDAEIAVDVPAESRAKARRQARRTREELECVKDFAKLSEAQRAAWNQGYAVNGVLEHVLAAKQVTKVLGAVSSSEQQKLAVEGLMKALGGG